MYILITDLFHKGFEEEVMRTDRIATENIVCEFVYLGRMEEEAASGVSGYTYKEKKII